MATPFTDLVVEAEMRTTFSRDDSVRGLNDHAKGRDRRCFAG
jgi:hypothetical protein